MLVGSISVFAQDNWMRRHPSPPPDHPDRGQMPEAQFPKAPELGRSASDISPE